MFITNVMKVFINEESPITWTFTVILVHMTHINPYPAAKVYASAISTAAKVSVNKCSTKDAHIPPLSPYSIFILMFTIINIMWKLKNKE